MSIYLDIRAARITCATPSASRDALGELFDADREHDAARDALAELTRRVAERGWIDLEADALRQAGERFVRAQARRSAVIQRLSLFLITAPEAASQ